MHNERVHGIHPYPLVIGFRDIMALILTCTRQYKTEVTGTYAYTLVSSIWRRDKRRIPLAIKCKEEKSINFVNRSIISKHLFWTHWLPSDTLACLRDAAQVFSHQGKFKWLLKRIALLVAQIKSLAQQHNLYILPKHVYKDQCMLACGKHGRTTHSLSQDNSM